MAESQSDSQPKDVWASGAGYEAYVGRWSRRVARQFVDWLAVPPGGRWLDVACGTGALSETILDRADPAEVHGVDLAQGFVDHARNRVNDPRVVFQTGDAQSLPVESAGFDAVVSGLALNFIPQPEKAVAEMRRAAEPGGQVALYVWDYAGRMQFMRFFWKAVAELDPAHAGLDEGTRFPLCNPQPLARLLGEAGLRQVAVRPIDIWTEFRDFDDFWTPFLGGQGPGPSYVMALSETDRAALREHLRSRLLFASDGSLPLAARAWAARGVR